MSEVKCDIEDEIRESLREHASDLFDDTIASMFGDKEAIRSSMLGMLLREQTTIMARVLGMEQDPFRGGLRLANRNNDGQIVGALAPLTDLANEAVQQFVNGVDGSDMAAKVTALLKKNEPKLIAEILDSANYRMRREVEQKLSQLIDSHTTRIATEMFANLGALKADQWARREARQELARKRRAKAIQPSA